MNQYLIFALIGLGVGCLYAAIGVGVIITFRGTGVINFATGATAMWGTYVYAELRSSGDLVIPVVGLPHRIDLGEAAPFWLAFGIGVGSCALIGVLLHVLVFRPLRHAPVLAKVVASVGVLLFFQALTALQFGTTSRPVAPIMPSDSISMAGLTFPQDRLWLTAVVGIVTALVAAWFRYTRTGLATIAAAENERTAALAGYSPQRLAAATWVLSGVVVGAIGILVAPTTVMNPSTYALAIVPALAAVLVGQFRSIAATAIAALALGLVPVDRHVPGEPTRLAVMGGHGPGRCAPVRGDRGSAVRARRSPAQSRCGRNGSAPRGGEDPPPPIGRRGGHRDRCRGHLAHVGDVSLRCHHQHDREHHHAVARRADGLRRPDLAGAGVDRRDRRIRAVEDHDRPGRPVPDLDHHVELRRGDLRRRDRRPGAADQRSPTRCRDARGRRRRREVRLP